MEGQAMSAAEALQAALEAGITIVLDGEALLLEADAKPAENVILALARQKEAILELLRNGNNTRAVERTDRSANERSIIQWLNEHPAPSDPGHCAWCGSRELPGAVVLPFGTEPGTHIWLHAECWRPWHETRRNEARMALQADVE
jgi:hypothetical protein